MNKKYKVEFSNVANLPTRFGEFKVISVKEYLKRDCFEKACEDAICPVEHLVVYTKNIGEIPLVRVHSECLTGDAFGSLKCDCGGELAMAMEQIYADSIGGMMIYLRQEGRGIGLFNKIDAYSLQDGGLDTVEANIALGLPSDNRTYSVVGEIFKHFDIKQIRLLTNNPLKIKEIEKYAKIQRSEIIVPPNEKNKEYLKVKKLKMGHLL